jgi:hypothetical protein
MKSSFGTSELIKCLFCLGFTKQRSTGSSHEKYASPNIVTKGTRPFIAVILKRKIYDKHTQASYLRQIRNLGFTTEKITKCMP